MRDGEISDSGWTARVRAIVKRDNETCYSDLDLVDPHILGGRTSLDEKNYS